MQCHIPAFLFKDKELLVCHGQKTSAFKVVLPSYLSLYIGCVFCSNSPKFYKLRKEGKIGKISEMLKNVLVQNMQNQFKTLWQKIPIYQRF